MDRRRRIRMDRWTRTTMLAVVLLVAMCVWCNGDDVVESVTQPDDAIVNSVDKEVLRYLPDDCDVFAILKVQPILRSAFVQNLGQPGTSFKDSLDVTLAPIDLKADAIDRVFLAAKTVQSGAQARYLAIVFCRELLEPARFDDAANITPDRKIQIGKYTAWDTRGDQEMVVCAVEEHVLLVGDLATVRGVLRRDGPGKLPESKDTIWMLPQETGADLVVSFVPRDNTNWMQIQSLPLAAGALRNIDAVGLEVNFRKDLDVQVSVLCDNEQLADRLGKIVTGLCAWAQLQDVESQHVNFRPLLESIECAASDRVVTAKMTVPHQLVQYTTTSAPTLLAEIGKPVPPATCPPGSVCSPSYAPQPYNCQPYGAVPYYNPPQAYPPSALPYANAAPYPTPPRYQPYGATVLRRLKIADVIRLAEAGVSDEVIVRFVKKHQLDAPLSVDDLILLTNQVSTQVITTLQDLPVARQTPYTPPVPPPATPAPLPPRYDESSGQPQPFTPAMPATADVYPHPPAASPSLK